MFIIKITFENQKSPLYKNLAHVGRHQKHVFDHVCDLCKRIGINPEGVDIPKQAPEDTIKMTISGLDPKDKVPIAESYFEKQGLTVNVTEK